MKFTHVVPCTWLPKGAKPGFKPSLLGSRDRAFYHSLLVLMKMMVMNQGDYRGGDGSGDADGSGDT